MNSIACWCVWPAKARRSFVSKAADPLIFGRGGEEIETLSEFGIPFEVVPGVTAAAGCAAYAGIPLTHRDHAQTVTFATGYLKDGSVDLDWQALVRPRQTVVFYMGIGGISIICRQMMAHGLPATHPVAVVQSGSTERQQVLIADLATMPDRVAEAGITSPTLIIVGSVVNLNTKLAWFEVARNAKEPHKHSYPIRRRSMYWQTRDPAAQWLRLWVARGLPRLLAVRERERPV